MERFYFAFVFDPQFAFFVFFVFVFVFVGFKYMAEIVSKGGECSVD